MSVLMGTKVFTHYMYIHYLELQNLAFDDCHYRDEEEGKKKQKEEEHQNVSSVHVYRIWDK